MLFYGSQGRLAIKVAYQATINNNMYVILLLSVKDSNRKEIADAENRFK